MVQVPTWVVPGSSPALDVSQKDDVLVGTSTFRVGGSAAPIKAALQIKRSFFLFYVCTMLDKLQFSNKTTCTCLSSSLLLGKPVPLSTKGVAETGAGGQWTQGKAHPASGRRWRVRRSTGYCVRSTYVDNIWTTQRQFITPLRADCAQVRAYQQDRPTTDRQCSVNLQNRLPAVSTGSPL